MPAHTSTGVVQRLRGFAYECAVFYSSLIVLGLICLSWTVLALPLFVLLSERAGTAAGRVGIMAGFRIYTGWLWLVRAYRLDLSAIDALRDGGTITLRTGESDGGSWVQVADDGSGMPPDVEARVFEPFFTTKGEDGTGLGLAMVYASMQRHGGSVRLETAPGKGTAFTLWFPRSASAKPPPASSR